MAERILRGWITYDDKMVQRIKLSKKEKETKNKRFISKKREEDNSNTLEHTRASQEYEEYK